MTASDTAPRRELTVLGLALGAAITLVFTAANVYLGLKVGLTFASSIPAAVISMAVLRMLRTGSIYENNIVQTVASAAGTLSSVIFVLPGLVMVGWWTGLPLLGKFRDLRHRRRARRDVYDSAAPRAGHELRSAVSRGRCRGGDPARRIRFARGERGRESRVCWRSSSVRVASAAFAAAAAMQVVTGEFDKYFRVGGGATGIGFGLSLALVGAGHLIGLSVGTCDSWRAWLFRGVSRRRFSRRCIRSPGRRDRRRRRVAHAGAHDRRGERSASRRSGRSGRLAAPVWNGLQSAIAASRKVAQDKRVRLPRTERDIPIGIVGIISLVCLIPIGLSTCRVSKRRRFGRVDRAARHCGGDIRRPRRISCRGRMRVHGRFHRLVEQSRLRARDPRGPRRVAAVCCSSRIVRAMQPSPR